MKIFFVFNLFAGLFILLFTLKNLQQNRRYKKFIGQKKAYSAQTQTSQVFGFYQLKEWLFKIFDKEGIIITALISLVLLALNALFLDFNPFFVILCSICISLYFIHISRKKRTIQDFEKNFPELLVVLNGAISAGNNLHQALSDCANSIDGVLQKELKTISRSLDIGDDITKVFEESYKRLPFRDYYFFLTSLSVSLNSGAKLKEILNKLAVSSTKAKAIEKKKETVTAEARMSAKIVALIPFIFLLILKFISPENFDFIIHDEKGRYILYYFLGSELLGVLTVMFLMRKIG